ncbi:hypothetical protein GGR28_003516 [Lewinella aquimaris]|uniref:DUF2237 domain-containing protein n=1 Tax=Neolewinella aquimaris TaxID=1835722 RepID=A0A840EBQ2_9BACT|nr:DUF2237 domain-containing protein [Neolewinella aquimaris]MBB4080877.1 hypothetical protein [Neolewinella aquimaris]
MKNVLGTPLQSCCTDPMTGYYRDGSCATGPTDTGRHVVCAVMTEEFLTFSKSRGNDLSTPIPAYDFPGLKPGDGWCLCALRWKEAFDAGMAPAVKLESTHEAALKYISFEALLEHKLVNH